MDPQGFVSSDLVQVSPGHWSVTEETEVSFPTDGHAANVAVENGSFWFRHRTKAILAAVAAHEPEGLVWDIGGGTGLVAAALIDASYKAILLEPGADGVAAARRRRVPVISGTLGGVAFKEGSVAAAGMFDVLEHIEGEHEALVEVFKALKPGGLLYLTVPAHQWLWSVDDEHLGHYRRYSRASLGAALAAVGFEVSYSSYLFWPLPPPILAVRTLPSRLGLRQKDKPMASGSEHVSGPVARALERAMAFEVSRVARGRPVPFGSSVLAVARRPDASASHSRRRL